MVEYRRAVSADINELVRLRIEFLKEVNGEDNIDSPILHKCEETLSNYFESSLSDESFIAWLALSEKKIVATSGMCFYNTPALFKKIDDKMQFRDGREAYIMNIYTIPVYRRRGLAEKLLIKILAEAKERGYRKISLHATEMGQRLYGKFGFKLSGDEMVLNI